MTATNLMVEESVLVDENAAPETADLDGVIDEMSDRLAVAFMRLHRAIAIDQYLVETDGTYQGGDVAVAVHETITAIESAVSAQRLIESQPFWVQSAYAASVATAHTLATLPVMVDSAADLMMDHLGGALDFLLGAKLHTDDSNIDDAISAVCRALSAAAKL